MMKELRMYMLLYSILGQVASSKVSPVSGSDLLNMAFVNIHFVMIMFAEELDLSM